MSERSIKVRIRLYLFHLICFLKRKIRLIPENSAQSLILFEYVYLQEIHSLASKQMKSAINCGTAIVPLLVRYTDLRTLAFAVEKQSSDHLKFVFFFDVERPANDNSAKVIRTNFHSQHGQSTQSRSKTTVGPTSAVVAAWLKTVARRYVRRSDRAASGEEICCLCRGRNYHSSF